MKFISILSVAALAGSAIARDPRNADNRLGQKLRRDGAKGVQAKAVEARAAPTSYKPKTIIPQNAKTKPFVVNGTAIPDVNFDIGESYAGLLPVSSAKNASELYFWFFPSTNADAGDEITIWLNVCSSNPFLPMPNC